MTWKLFYLIFMPLIYKLIQMFVLNDVFEKEHYKHHIICVGFYYFIEIIFVMIHYIITKEWVFSNNIMYDFGCFEFFTLCSVMFIIVHVVLLGIDNEPQNGTHCIVLLIFFLVFSMFNVGSLLYGVKNQDFNNMPYEKIETKTINLEAFSDTHTTTGEITGRRYYISGEIRDNYEIYYSFLDERGSLIIRSFVYTEEHCDIFPEENCPNPTLEITTYSKSYKDLSSTYSDYVLHIPKNETIGTGINME